MKVDPYGAVRSGPMPCKDAIALSLIQIQDMRKGVLEPPGTWRRLLQRYVIYDTDGLRHRMDAPLIGLPVWHELELLLRNLGSGQTNVRHVRGRASVRVPTKGVLELIFGL